MNGAIRSRATRKGAAVLATLFLTIVVSPSPSGALPAPFAAQELDASLWSGLRYRHVGPVGNRVSAVAGVPGQPDVYYIGAASGGVFKTVDGGIQWRPVFDDQPVQSIGSLAIAPSDSNVIWAGTGETFIRSNVVTGNGIYKSVDGGRSWRHMGLDESGRIGRIIVHPDDPETVWAAVMGHCYGPQQERGVFKTTDGGRSWRRVLFVDENTGASDLAVDPTNPRILYAGMWPMQIWTWGRRSGGPGGGIHRSVDGGETWEQLTEPGAAPAGMADSPHGRGTLRGSDGVVGQAATGAGRGLPTGPLGKIGLTTTPDDPGRIYALIETSAHADFATISEDGVLWRSDDGGNSWSLVNRDHTLHQRPLYYTRALAAPDDADTIHFLATRHSISLDGGATFVGGNAGGDNHDMWIDPTMPDRMIVGHDGGVSISTTRGRSWWRPRLPIAQMYHVFTDNRVPYFLYGNRQDGPSYRGPSNSLTRGGIPIGTWHSVGGCESGFAVPDPVDPNVVWSGCFEGILDRYDLRTGHAQNVSVWPDNPEGWPAAELRYRFQWTFPIAVSPHDNEVVYAGSQHVHRTANGGRSWEVISPDLTTNDKELQQKTGGLTTDDSSPTYAAVLFAIAESPAEAGVIWAGSNDGLLHVTRDHGATWNDVTASMPELPPLGTMSNVEPSRHAPGRAYVAVDLHQVNSTEPRLYRTDDYGASWNLIVDGIPAGPLSYTHVIREDPVREGLLYAGTGNALYVSFDDGARWQPLQNNLPHAPVHWLTVQEHFNDLVVSTYGRGFWILDDITPLQQLDEAVRATSVHLFDPRPAYRFQFKEASVSQPGDSGAGENPDYGASIHYWLNEATATSDAPIRIDIRDARGDVVRSLRGGPRSAGINRVQWDLRFDPSRAPRLRTQPLEHEHAEFNEAGWRRLPEGGRVAPLAPPGEYEITLRVGGTMQRTTLEIRKDPGSAGTDAEIAEQHELLLSIRADLNAVAQLIDEIEWARKGIDDLQARLAEAGEGEVEGAGAVLATAESLDAQLIELEMLLFDLRLSGGSAGQDTLRWPRRLWAKLGSLASYVSGTDFAPTSQQLEVYALYRQQLADYQASMGELRDEIDSFDATLAERGLGIIGRR